MFYKSFFSCSLRFAQEHREKIKFEDFHDLLHMFLPSLFALSQWFMVRFSGRARERFTKLILNVAGNAPNRIVIIAINTDLLLVCLSKQNVFPIISLDCMVCVCLFVSHTELPDCYVKDVMDNSRVSRVQRNKTNDSDSLWWFTFGPEHIIHFISMNVSSPLFEFIWKFQPKSVCICIHILFSGWAVIYTVIL